MPLAYFDFVGITAVSNSFNGIQTMTPSNFSSNMLQTALFLPNIGALMILIMIGSSWMLSFFFKAHPLAAIYAIAMLIIYLAISFFVSNAMIQVMRISSFSTILPNAGLLVYIMMNMPLILVFATVVDVAIAIISAMRT